MGIAAGPYNSRDGLVLWYDVGNSKSFRGEATTNLVVDPEPSGLWSVSNYLTSSATLTYEIEDGIKHLKLSNITSDTGYPRIQYTYLSATISNNFSASFEAKGTPGSQIVLSLYSQFSTKVTLTATLTNNWQRFEFPNTSNGGFVLDYPYIRPLTTGATQYIRRIQVENKSYATTFVSGTRGTTVATGGGLIDLSGRSNNAELVNGPTYSSSLGGLVSFDGTNDYLLLPNGVLSGTGEFTIIQFLRAGSDAVGTVFGNYPSGNLQVFFGTNVIGFWLGNSSTYLGVSPWTTQLPQYTNEPVMIAAVRSGTTTQFWINDKIEKTGSSSFSIGTTSSQFRIGTNTSGGEVFSGSIFNTQVYNRALSSVEIIQAYNSLRNRFVTRTSIVTSGLVLHLDAGNPNSYKGSGTTWVDLSGYGTNGTLTNGPSLKGGNGGSSQLDGVNDYIITNLTGVITTMTVECWFRGTSTTRNHLWNFGNYGDNSNLNFNFNDSGYDLWVYWESGGTNRVRYNIDGSFTDGAIKHVVFTHTGSTNKVYLNGTELTITESGGTQTFTAVNLSGYFAIGNVVAFGGNVYTVRVYNRALSASEVLQNYNATKSRFGL